MKELTALVRKIIVGSTALLTTGSASEANDHAKVPAPLDPAPGHSILQASRPIGPPKLVLKKVQLSDDWTLASHRSHRSHSSHRSSYTSPSRPSRTESKPKEEEKTQSQQKSTLYDNTTSRTLRRGMKGSDVLELKKLLRKHGYKIELTEDFDEMTEIIVKDFQAKNGIPDDGIVAPLTLYMLRKER